MSGDRQTLSERVAVAESRIAAWEAQAAIRDHKLDKMDSKLDDLISLRDKGFGVFWLASTIFGTGIVGGITALWHWLKG